jgi:hypothetical protein
MNSKDILLLEKTYLSMSKKLASVPSDVVPGEEMSLNGLEASDHPEMPLSLEAPVSISPREEEVSLSSLANNIFSSEETECDDEEHEMIIDNMNSIRDSITKIADFCMTGKGLEPWQSQKLAIAMDNLAEIARRLH